MLTNDILESKAIALCNKIGPIINDQEIEVVIMTVILLFSFVTKDFSDESKAELIEALKMKLVLRHGS